jgi:hypothetical protein
MSHLTIVLLASFFFGYQLVLAQCSEGSTPCGYYAQLCCAPGQVCATDGNNQAMCVSGPPSCTCSASCGIWGQVTETVVWSTIRVYSTFIGTGCFTTPSTTASISTITITSPALQTRTTPSTSSPTSTTAQPPVCSTGWYMCSTEQGGGCCPIGYECGASNQCVVASESSSILKTNTTTSCTTSTSSISCDYALNESPCGNICCKSGYYCASVGICSAVGSAPLRPTTSSAVGQR